MDIISIIKESWLFDEHLKGVTGPLIVTITLWLIRSMRRFLFPFFWIFKNNLSSGFFKLSIEDKLNALKLIGEYKETDEKHDVLIKEFKLKQYGLSYPISILKVLFDYVYDKNIRMNNIGFLSFLDCYNIFDYDRNTMPTYSPKKITIHIIGYLVFIVFLAGYCVTLSKNIGLLYHSSVNFINILTIIAMSIIFIITIRISYIFIESVISFIWAVMFSRKLKEYYLLRKECELIEKYKVIT